MSLCFVLLKFCRKKMWSHRDLELWQNVNLATMVGANWFTVLQTKRQFRLLPWATQVVVVVVILVRSSLSGSDALRTIWPRIAKFSSNICDDLPFIPTGCDITRYSWSEVIANCRLKYRLRRLWVEYLGNGLTEDRQMSQVYRRQTASYERRIWHHLQLPVGCKKDQKTGYRCHIRVSGLAIDLIRVTNLKPSSLASCCSNYSTIGKNRNENCFLV